MFNITKYNLMRTKIILFTIFILAITAAFISMNKVQTMAGPHGGRLQQAEKFNIETKISYSEIYAYLLNKQCKPISNKEITCEIKFFFPDSTAFVSNLKPYGEDGFKIESNITGYQSYRVSFNAFGKIISAKFENENLIVLKKL